MKRQIASMFPGFLLGAALLVAASPAAAYVCPGGTADYVTSCTGQPQGTKCILTLPNTGCCLPGNCSSNGVCNIPSQVPLSVCPNDNNPCTQRSCTTSGLNPVCGQTPDPSQAGKDCSAVDGNQCTIDKCNSSGVCTFQSNKDCSNVQFDPQCASGVACNPSNGNCETQVINQGQPCDDGFDCTFAERCNNGACGTGAGAGAFRPPGFVCADHDYCNPGVCNGDQKKCPDSSRHPLPAGAECNFNSCSHATCDVAGGNCVFQNCDLSATTCDSCGGTACIPSAGDDPNFPCGCDNDPYNQ